MLMKIDFVLQIQKSFKDRLFFKNNFMKITLTDDESANAELNKFEKIIQYALDLIYTLFNKSENSRLKSNESEMLNSLIDLRASMTTNFNNINHTMTKMRNEIKLLKMQNRKLQPIIDDYQMKNNKND